jgi:hypothetical protein
MAASNKKSIDMTHVMRLSKGKRSGANIGSRSVGHHLNQYEKGVFERALKQQFLSIDERARDNLWHIWEKACLAKHWPCLVLVKQTDQAKGVIYRDFKMIYQGDLAQAKARIRQYLEPARA